MRKCRTVAAMSVNLEVLMGEACGFIGRESYHELKTKSDLDSPSRRLV